MKEDRIKGLILAAGRGSRMDYLTSENPKCFTELGGKRLIDWQLESFQKASINDIAIVTGYLKKQFDVYDLIKFNNENWQKTNMVSSLMRAASFIDSDTIVSYSDIIFHKDAVTNIINCKGDIVLGYDKNWLNQWQLRFENPKEDAESFEISEENILIDIGNRINSTDKVMGQYTGLFKLTPTGMEKIEETLCKFQEKKDSLDMTALFQLMIKEGFSIFATEIKTYWFEIDTPADLKIAERLYNSNQLKIS
tara:strand:- start:507 stop:1259 length:753 start_codon:yes stop_codon:yes gene_type:complete